MNVEYEVNLSKSSKIDLNKTSRDHKRLLRVHLFGCQGVNLLLPKDFFKFCQKVSFVSI